MITQEDYVGLFRPNEYRHTKLPLTIKESTTVVLGYALNDINVLTAVDWSKNVFSSTSVNYPHEMFQILYKKENHKNSPYRNKDGIIIIEVDSLESFFEELMFDLDIEVRSHKKLQKDLGEINELFLNPSKENINKFLKEASFRKQVFSFLIDYEINLISGFIVIFSQSLEETWMLSKQTNAFFAYAQILEILIDILISIPLDKMPPILLEMVASNLNSVCWYVGDAKGKSHKSLKVWNANKNLLPQEIIVELFHIATNQKYYTLKSFLNEQFDDFLNL